MPAAPALETSAQRRNRESTAAEPYARRVLIPGDRTTGERFVHAGWFQHFMRLRIGSSATPQRVKQALLRDGWLQRGHEGRIKATEPGTKETIVLAFYVVNVGWEDGLAGAGDGR